jgi:hypothetical protein
MMINTSWQNGLTVLQDSTVAETMETLVVTDRSNHIVACYSTPHLNNQPTPFMRVMTNRGALMPPLRVPDEAVRTQKDAHFAAIDSTDSIVGAWASNDGASTTYKIFVRKFDIAPSGIAPSAADTLVSGQNGHYVCPNVIYNAAMSANGLVFVCWVGVTDKKIEGVFLNTFDLSPASYTSTVATNINPAYYSSSGAAYLNTSAVENIVLFNVGDKIFIVYQETASILHVASIAAPEGGRPVITPLTSYEYTSMDKFDATFDPKEHVIMLVFSSLNIIYGDKISVFGAASIAASPVQLNNDSYPSTHPRIFRVSDRAGGHHFLVCWNITTGGLFYNKFDSHYYELSAEAAINIADRGTTNPRINASANQLVVFMQANIGPNGNLTQAGTLLYTNTY